MQANSRNVFSSQFTLHERLQSVVYKHLQHSYLKPPSPHTIEAFADFLRTVETVHRPIILDSGCGVGDSTIFLGQRHPEFWVVGIDKSEVRLRKARTKIRPENVVFQRADQFDFWRLARLHQVQFAQHYIFYPNPWPKKDHLQRRIHGHPAFSDLLWISNKTMIRSNWRLFLEEFAAAYELATQQCGNLNKVHVENPITLFEKKFLASGHNIYEFTT